MVEGQQSILEQIYLMTCQLNFVSIAKKRILKLIFFDPVYSTLSSCVYPSIYVSMLPSVLQFLTFIDHGVAGASCPRNVFPILPYTFMIPSILGGAMYLFSFYLVYLMLNYRNRIDSSICYGI